MKLTDFNRIHCIGIGGIGMSGLARLFVHEKKQVSGSDRDVSPITCGLEALGIEFSSEQVKANISSDIELVVYTEAMPKDNEEMIAARALGVPMMNYFEALGMVANEYYLIAVSGTHGKTTTTAMLIDIFETAELDPTAIVGSLRAKTGSNFRSGKSKYFIVEACEYKEDFLSLTPDILVITNLEHDHVDYYKTLGDVQNAFRTFAGQVREGGVVVMNFGGDNIAPVLEGLTVPIIDYGKSFNPLLKLKIPGVHNQMNAAAALAVAEHVGISKDMAEKALEGFVGTWRRFEYKGELNGAKIYDDYAHHPTEIEATLTSTRELYPDKKIIVAFQSHTYTRTHEFYDEFVDALALADVVCMLPIYAAREENVSGVTHTQIVDSLRAKKSEAYAVESFDEAEQKLRDMVDSNTVIITMGAGENNKIADSLTST